MQLFLVSRLVTLATFVLLQGAIGILAGLILFSKGNLIMGSQFAPSCIYELAISVLSALWISAMLIIDLTTRSSPTSKLKFELLWLALLSIFLLGGSTALTATLPFPRFDGLSEELKWMGKLASDRLLVAQILSWVACLVLLLLYLVPLTTLSLLHSNSCPHLLDWNVAEFDWFRLPSKSSPASPPSLSSLEQGNMSSLSNLALTLSAAPPARQQPISSPNAFYSSSFAHSRSQLKVLKPPPTALNLSLYTHQKQESLAGMSFFLPSPSPENPVLKSAKERREERDRERARRERTMREGDVSEGAEGGPGVRLVDKENRRRYYGEAGWSHDI